MVTKSCGLLRNCNQHGSVEAGYPWVWGLKLHQIREMSQVMWAIRRLREVQQQLIFASQSIRETQLEGKIRSRGISAIVRSASVRPPHPKHING